MAYKRVIASTELLRGDSLTRAMVGIGMLFAAEPNSEVNIEDTLLAASAEGMEHDDLRVLAVLVTWIKIHHTWINADRLTRAVLETQSSRIRAFWRAIASWLQKDRRFTRMQHAYDGPRVDVLRNQLCQHDPKRMITPVVNRTLHTYFSTLRILCDAFHIDTKGKNFRCEKRLIDQAQRINQQGKMLIPIIDDAHLMDIDSLRRLRLLFEDFPKNHNLILVAQLSRCCCRGFHSPSTRTSRAASPIRS